MSSRDSNTSNNNGINDTMTSEENAQNEDEHVGESTRTKTDFIIDKNATMIPFYRKFQIVQAQLENKLAIRPFELVSTFSKSQFLQVANERLKLERTQFYERLKYDNSDSR